MGNSKLSALLSLIGVMLIWPYVLTKSVSPRVQTAGSGSLPAGQEEKRPHVVKRSTQNCNSSHENYCLNNGQCMLLLDINEHHCKCERGFSGPRCDLPELVFQPVGEGQIILIIFCVSLLITGLAGTVYLCCKWQCCVQDHLTRDQVNTETRAYRDREKTKTFRVRDQVKTKTDAGRDRVETKTSAPTLHDTVKCET